MELQREYFALYLIHGIGASWDQAGTIAATTANAIKDLVSLKTTGKTRDHRDDKQPSDFIPAIQAKAQKMPRKHHGLHDANSPAANQILKRLAGF